MVFTFIDGWSTRRVSWSGFAWLFDGCGYFGERRSTMERHAHAVSNEADDEGEPLLVLWSITILCSLVECSEACCLSCLHWMSTTGAIWETLKEVWCWSCVWWKKMMWLCSGHGRLKMMWLVLFWELGCYHVAINGWTNWCVRSWYVFLHGLCMTLVWYVN